jgi:site-specific recombinase XerD
LIFRNQAKTRFTGQRFEHLYRGWKVGRKAGISDVSWHTLRHTFASRLIDRGVDIVTVQQLLGHSTVTVTMRYTHTNLDSKKAAVAKLVGLGDNLVTVAPKCSNRNPQLSQMAL